MREQPIQNGLKLYSNDYKHAMFERSILIRSQMHAYNHATLSCNIRWPSNLLCKNYKKQKQKIKETTTNLEKELNMI